MPLMTHIDLFSGIGGFSLGAKNLGIDTIAYSEIDKAAIEAYELNFPGHQALGDITKLETLPYADIVTGGVPCQAWSSGGNKLGFDDPRGRLWLDTIRVIKNSQPKAIICENVKGLTSTKHRDALNLILKSFSDAGYDLFYQVLNSKNFGVPQSRERIFIIGFRKDLGITNFKFPVGSLTEKAVADILEKKVPETYLLSEVAIGTMNRNYGEKKRWEKGLHHESNKCSRTLLAILHKGVPYNVLVNYIDSAPSDFKIHQAKIDKNMITECIGADKRKYRAIVRRFMPRECARLQGYPDDFKLHPVNTHAYKQIGNSVTVPVVQKLMELVKAKLDGA